LSLLAMRWLQVGAPFSKPPAGAINMRVSRFTPSSKKAISQRPSGVKRTVGDSPGRIAGAGASDVDGPKISRACAQPPSMGTNHTALPSYLVLGSAVGSRRRLNAKCLESGDQRATPKSARVMGWPMACKVCMFSK
jgi:hypothetical protein